MSKLHFDYWMELNFTEVVTESHYTIKCLPKDTDMQRISDVNINIIPENSFQNGEDSFGNLTVYGNVLEPHNKFGFHISGNAETNLSNGETVGEDEYTGIYLYPYGLNKAGEEIKDYFEKIAPDFDAEKLSNSNEKELCSTNYEKAKILMSHLHEDFTYESGSTNMSTTAEEAFRQRKGVCQDYAHILIALCQLAKIPARYVAGMMVGEGYSHAWVEVLSDGIWYALDPTHACEAKENYIKIGVGRDAEDCMINKGILKGGGMQTQEIRVLVEELPVEV